MINSVNSSGGKFLYLRDEENDMDAITEAICYTRLQCDRIRTTQLL